MGVWIFDLADAGVARALYDTLPPPLKPACELQLELNGGHLRAASDEAAQWLRDRAEAA
ncbi:MAG: hypothetical protein V4466_17045 [Pseudomonadota bacterium]